MANSYFQFKQFRVNQDQCAMKVGTLACIFGASIKADHPKKILDIGTGTGLLSLMAAQRFKEAVIEAVEIDESAFKQAKNNFKISPWSTRLHIQHGDFLKTTYLNKFNLILSNPPFFDNHLKSPDLQINLARHTDQLPLNLLIENVKGLLEKDGFFAILLPEMEMTSFIEVAEKYKLFPCFQLNILNFQDQPPKAIVCQFTFRASPFLERDLIIRKSNHEYSEEYMALLKDFYLQF